MFTKSDTSLRRLSAYMLTLLLFCATFSRGALAQTPLVTGSFAPSLAAPTGLGTVYTTALDSYGDLLVVDYAKGALYEYPVNGGAVITLLPAGSLGGYANPALAIGASNDLYIGGNYNNCLIRLPYDIPKATWDGLSTISAANGKSVTTLCPSTSPAVLPLYDFAEGDTPNLSPYYFQPWAITIDPNNNVLIATNNGGFLIFTLPVNGTGVTSTPSKVNSLILNAMTQRARSIAEDKYGNIYFVEETGQKVAPLPGVLMIPAGSTSVASDTTLARVDPNLPTVTGVTTDASGNLYISDSTDGVFFVPNPSGTPKTSAAVLLTPLPADGQVSVDSTRGILYVPTNQSGSQTIAAVRFNAAEFGSTAAGATAATSQSVLFGFTGSATPTSFAIEEAGASTPDFTLATGGTCAAGTAYAAQSGCSQNVTLSPHAAGSVSAELVVLGASNAILGSITLHGTGTGSAAQILPGGQTATGAGLKKPSQIAVDAAGNMYIADSGLGAVEVYPKGYGTVAATTTVGKSLTAPTGVAVDGAGDVFIADSGNAIEVPIGSSGLNAAGQITLKTGLGANLKLAVDGIGHLFIADPSNGRVVKLGNLGGTLGLLGQTETDLTGFNTPSAIAVDASDDLFVVDGSNVIEVTPSGTKSTFTNFATGATGIAVDPSGAVYVAVPGGTTRIPYVGGTLTASGETVVASNVTNPTSVAIDSAENVYVTDGTAQNVELISASATTNFGTLTSQTGTQASGYTILDVGNAPLNVTGFSSTPDYSETSTSCTGGPVSVGSTCTATITFNPGPGDQGTLSGYLLLQSDAANAPVGVNVTGVGAGLATSTTTITVTGATVDGAPAIITVAPKAGTGVAPTGQVTLTITGSNLKAGVTVVGKLANGTVTLTPPQLPAGTYSFSVAYQGDRTYGPSTASAQAAVAIGAVTLTQASLVPSLSLVQSGGQWYVLAGGSGSQEPYDSSISQFEYNYPMQVAATDLVPLIGQPVYTTINGVTKQTATNYGSITFQGAPYGASGGCAPASVASDGTATLSTSCLLIDTSNNAIPDLETTYTITPAYTPLGAGASCDPIAGTCPTNPNYASVTGKPITLTALRNPVVQISSNPASLTVSAGSTTSATLTLTSLLGYGIAGAGGLLNNYSFPVQLSCDGLPAYATCSFSYPTPDPTDPQSVDVGPSAGTSLSYMGAATAPCKAAAPGSVGGCFGPGTVIMTIKTNITSGVAEVHRGQGKTEFATVFGLGLLGFAFGKKRLVRGHRLTLVCLLLCSGIIACISGCSTTQLGTSSGTATPAGKYSVSVTAKQVGSQVITSSGVITTVYGNGNQMSLPFTISVSIN